MTKIINTAGFQQNLDAVRIPAKLLGTSVVAFAFNVADLGDIIEAFCEAQGLPTYAFYLANFGALLCFRLASQTRRT